MGNSHNGENVMSKAIEDVIAERRRQVEAEGFSHANDDMYGSGELPMAAACYAMNVINPAGNVAPPPMGWPWLARWWKPKGPRRDLVRAAALIIAEIERLDRRAAR
jgi:hypothetical protein